MISGSQAQHVFARRKHQRTPRSESRRDGGSRADAPARYSACGRCMSINTLRAEASVRRVKLTEPMPIHRMSTAMATSTQRSRRSASGRARFSSA